MKKAIIYCRVSTEEQAKDGHLSMDSQERQCRELARGYDIIRVFKDPGRSGGDFSRPGLLEMLDFIKNNDIEVLFTQHTDRLARDVIIHHQIKRELAKNKVELYTALGGKIEDTPDGKMADGMLAVVNEYHKNITSYKTRKTMLDKAMGGWFPGEAPLGYKNVGMGPEERIRIIKENPEVSRFIKLAYKMFATSRYSVDELIDILYQKGFRSKRGLKMCKSKMNYILKNPFYIGELHWAEVHVQGKHKPIIDKSLYQQVQRVFAEHNHHACRRRKYSFLLRGYLFCGCGARLTAGWFKNKTKSYYYCQNRKKCNESYVPSDKLESQVEQLFQKIQFSDDFIGLVMGKVKTSYQEIQQANKQRKQTLINQKNGVELKRDKAEEKLIDGTLNNKDFTRIRSKLQNELDNIEYQLSETYYERELNIDQIQEILDFSKNIGTAYQSANTDLKKQYLGLFFDKLIITNKKIEKPIFNPLFDSLIKAEKACYKTQKPSLKEKVFMTSSVPYSNTKVRIRTEWGAQRESDPR